MITVNIKDGLGNQMFQFATAYAVAKRNNTNIICDTRSLEEKIISPPTGYVVREFSLDIFNIYPSKLNFFDKLITFQINKKYATRFFFFARIFLQQQQTGCLEIEGGIRLHRRS